MAWGSGREFHDGMKEERKEMKEGKSKEREALLRVGEGLVFLVCRGVRSGGWRENGGGRRRRMDGGFLGLVVGLEAITDRVCTTKRSERRARNRHSRRRRLHTKKDETRDMGIQETKKYIIGD